MLTGDQTWRILRVATEQYPGHATTVAAFLLAVDDRITFQAGAVARC